MIHYSKYLIDINTSIKNALKILDEVSQDGILFAVDSENKLLGSLTDGDVRRGLINNISVEDTVEKIIEKKPKFIIKGGYDIELIIKYRNDDLKIIPIVNENKKIINVINFRYLKSYLPIDVVIMAGGKGTRLKPLTDDTPKPMLLVGDKPILEHNLSRLAKYGVDDFWISINYLGNQIVDYFKNGNERNISIKYVNEDIPLGTIGSVSRINDFTHDYILITNSDLLSNIDYEHFFIDFIKEKADFSVLTIPYSVDIPYAVLETENNRVKNFKEKPKYTYYSNGGVYLIKKNLLNHIPKNEFFNATDLMEKLINKNYKVTSYPFSGYWLDVGKHEDYNKAQLDINSNIFK